MDLALVGLGRCDVRPQVQRNQRSSPDCQQEGQNGERRSPKEHVD